MSISPNVAATLCFIFGLCSGVYLLRSLVRWRASQNWPRAAGTILESCLDENSDGYIPHVSYEYAMKGQRYTSDRLYFHNCNGGSEQAATKHIAAYPVGKRVSVYFDVRNPGDSVLDRHMPVWRPIFWLFFHYFFIYMGTMFLRSDDQSAKNMADATFQYAATPHEALQRTPG